MKKLHMSIVIKEGKENRNGKEILQKRDWRMTFKDFFVVLLALTF